MNQQMTLFDLLEMPRMHQSTHCHGTNMRNDEIDDALKKSVNKPNQHDLSIYAEKYNSFDVVTSFVKSGKSNEYNALLISLPVIGRNKSDVEIEQVGPNGIKIKSVIKGKDPYPITGGHTPKILTNNGSRFAEADHNSSESLTSKFNFDLDVVVSNKYDLSTLVAKLENGLLYIFIDVIDQPGLKLNKFTVE